MNYGYCGKIAYVDLTNKTVMVEKRGEEFYKKILGGDGLGAWLINEKVPVKADALGEKNGLCIATGFLNGTAAPASPRVMVMTKSPITGGFGDSNAGGSFGPELKKCGYDALYIYGKSQELIGLMITDEKIEFCDAENLKGCTTSYTQKMIADKYNCNSMNVAAIGISGEKKSLIAAIMFGDRAAARSGVGAVMGSKNLKFIAAKGTQNIQINDKETVLECNKEFREYIRDTDYFVIDVMRKHGSCGFMSLGIQLGIGPIKNWSLAGEASYPNHAKINGENVTKYRTKRHGCLHCPIACGGTVKVEDGPFALDDVRLPEYETIQAFAPFILCEDIKACFKAQQLCDDAGIDTISAGHVVAFAIECFENGIITQEDTDGLVLKWGDPEAAIKLTQLICERKGFGALLADGVKKAIDNIGEASRPYGIHIGGQEPAFHDFRYEAPSRGLTYIAEPTPARHERCSGGQLLQLNKPLGKNIEFQPEKIEMGSSEDLAKVYVKGSQYYSAFSSCGFCAYTLGACSKLDIVRLINAVTGWKTFTAQDFLDAGKRAFMLRQIFSLREGVKYSDIVFPERLTKPTEFEGALSGRRNTIDWYELRKHYFKAYDCDEDTGLPNKKVMQELEIGQFFAEV